MANLLEAVVILPIAAVQDRLGLLAAFATAVRPSPPSLRCCAVVRTYGLFHSSLYDSHCVAGDRLLAQAPLIFVTYAGLALAVRLGRKTKAD